MKKIIQILTIILIIYGLLLFLATIRFGIGIYTPILLVFSFVSLLIYKIDKILGVKILFWISTLWILRYFEHLSFLILYIKNTNIGMWITILIPIILAVSILFISFKEIQIERKKVFKYYIPIILILGLFTIGFLSFVKKTHKQEFNCWYNFNEKSKNYKVEFCLAPGHTIETVIDSKTLKEIVLKHGIKYECQEGLYCPETKVAIETCFKKIISIKILGFRNSETDYNVVLEEPIEIDVNKIVGNKEILKPRFNLGD